MDLKRYILPKTIENTDENQKMGDLKFNTTDYVFLDFDDEIKDIDAKDRMASLTDYAVANGSLQYWSGITTDGKKGTGRFWLRSAYTGNKADAVNSNGNRNYMYVFTGATGACPALNLNLSSIISARAIFLKLTLLIKL